MLSWLHNADSPAMHFAVGMLCAGAIWMVVLLVRPRWWLYMPLVMTAGGLWAEGPDIPLLAKEFPNLPGVHWLGGKALSESLHNEGADLFFFHGTIDRSGNGGSVRGWAVGVGLYNAWLCLFVAREWARRRRRRRQEEDSLPRAEGPLP